ncbi:hypothetical protein CR513_14850, partial [Mucuna pruriens]
MSSYQIIFGKCCHLLNTELTGRSRSAIWPMTKPVESGNYSCKSWKIYAWRLMRTPGSTRKRLRLIASKLCSRWDGSFIVTNIFPYGTVKVRDEANNRTFKVNGQQLKPYHEGQTLSSNMGEVEVLITDSKFVDRVRADSGFMPRPGSCRDRITIGFALTL